MTAFPISYGVVRIICMNISKVLVMPTVWIINDILVLIPTTYTQTTLPFSPPHCFLTGTVVICAAFPHLGMHFCQQIKVPSFLQEWPTEEWLVIHCGRGKPIFWKDYIYLFVCAHVCTCHEGTTCGTLFSPSPTESLTQVARLVGKHLSHGAILPDRNTTSLKWQCLGELLPTRSAPEDTRVISNDSFLTVTAEPCNGSMENK